MRFKIQVVIENEHQQEQIQNIVCLEKGSHQGHCAGLSLIESKYILKELQQRIILHQAEDYTNSNMACPCCQKQRRIKGYNTMQYKTLFGTVVIPSLRLYECACSEEPAKIFSVLKSWLPEHISPELQYIETKWASYISYERTAALMQDVLPVHATQNAVTVRNHLHKVAKRQERELEGKPLCLSGCANDWAKLPKPDKPLTVGIDGGYVRSWRDKQTNFEVIVGKSFSKIKPSKRFGFVQVLDSKPQRRLLHLLNEQGMQANQQITFR
ncbi:hypothetical protein IM40_10960 (plasmid) [Candidatus Paracaedimonas acanthamoebae]|nr:hypothetical protein IM40_09485 [Candidatus Paracaedimonas acanthamoebae]AIL13867.1 hypothetical protein IM40_10960 [Candidatus Paracaedimonas acanthamoebae]